MTAAACPAAGTDAPPFSEMGEEGRREYWATLALRHIRGIGPRMRARLLGHYSCAAEALEDCANWVRLGLPDGCRAEFLGNGWRAEAKKEWDHCARLDCRILLRRDFPARLAELADAPPLLYGLGRPELLASPAIAIVGSRDAGKRSLSIARELGASLAASGLTVVSGMAAGIDCEAHWGALAHIGKSIGVLGTGVDVAYPAKNRELYLAMRAEGLLLSEFPPGTPPISRHFPIRNRIISALSLGVVVVEAAQRSGSLITARCALEQNREVFAVPGAAFADFSLGCQNLIRAGAHPVFSVDDILGNLAGELRAYDISRPEASRPQPPAPPGTAPPDQAPEDFAGGEIAREMAGDDNSRKLLRALQEKGPMHIDALSISLSLSPHEVGSLLVCMEMLGQIRRLPGARYEAAR